MSIYGVCGLALFLIVVFFIFGFMILEYRKEKIKQTGQFASNNIMIYTDGWIKNNSDSSVRIKKVLQGRHSEHTQWIRELKPSEKIGDTVNEFYGYYILNMNGVEIGFVSVNNQELKIK